MRWILIVLGALTLCAAVLFWPGWWGQFSYWLYHPKGDEATKLQAISAVVQASTAVILVLVTCYYAYVTRQALDAAKGQAEIAYKQFELGLKQFRASMIPRLAVNVYPSLENQRHVCWSIENRGERDLLIQAAEIQWMLSAKEWTY
jgi:hypothetical protein